MFKNKRTKTVTLAVAASIVMGTVLFSSYGILQAKEAKSELQIKMWSAIEYYQSLKGTYKTFSERSGLTATVEFQVRQGDHPASYTKVMLSNGHVSESRCNGTHIIDKLDGKVMIASELAVKSVPVTKRKRPGPMYEGWGKDRVANHRTDPSYSGAATVTSPHAVSLSFLEYHFKWKIIGESTHLGRTVIVVSGKLPDYLSRKHEAERFKLWVDKELGILLKLEEYDEAGMVVEGHEVTYLEVNGELDEELLTLTQQEMEMKK